ncbi:MAG: ABC transporter substrate-binding protein [Aggregatilineales bacterium]
MRQNRFIFVSALLVLAAALSASLYLASAQDQPVFRIGVLDNESGPISNGARLAVQQINAAGGVRGADGTLFRLELVIQPTNFGLNLEEAVNNLRQASIIAALGPQADSEVLNGLPFLQGLGVPVMTFATNDTIIISDTTGRLLRMRAQQILQGQALARYLIEDNRLTNIAAVQLDLDSTDRVVGFAEAARSLGVTIRYNLLESTVETLANSLLEQNPQAAAAFGSPALASELYNLLRSRGWTGLFAYDQLGDPAFRQAMPLSELVGVISTSTWVFSLPDTASDAFLRDYVRAFGEVPGPVEAAAYDAINLVAEAIGLPGELLPNLLSLTDVRGVQGLLRPSQTPLGRGEFSNNTVVVRLGAFGAPEVVARFAGAERVPPDLGTIVSVTPTPAPTATPEGVVITIVSERQNVRSGPSTQFDIIGQAQRGDQFQVIGANRDNTWAVINFRGRQGWLSVSIADVFGDLNDVPIVDSPPTPTPGFTPTPTPPQEADIVIDGASVSPSPIQPGQPFFVNVIVRNAGSTPAGQFAVAATFPPNNVFASALVPGLAPGQSAVATLTGTLTNTGFYSVVIVADLNNEVPEGPAGEANNTFVFSYVINKPILNQGQITLNPGNTLDLEGNSLLADVIWNTNALQLDALGSAKLGILTGVTFDSVHWDMINPAVVNQTTILRSQLNAGFVIGVLTADGNRGAIRVDDIPGSQFVITFRVYQN